MMPSVRPTDVSDVLLGAHVAVLDFIFYTGKQFPARYRSGAFLAFHGSWNRSKRAGYEVAFIPFRPVGLLQLPDGSLLVSDDGGRKIWRVSYRGGGTEVSQGKGPSAPRLQPLSETTGQSGLQ